jgi:hypothetical protein
VSFRAHSGSPVQRLPVSLRHVKDCLGHPLQLQWSQHMQAWQGRPGGLCEWSTDLGRIHQALAPDVLPYAL